MMHSRKCGRVLGYAQGRGDNPLISLHTDRLRAVLTCCYDTRILHFLQSHDRVLWQNGPALVECALVKAFPAD